MTVRIRWIAGLSLWALVQTAAPADDSPTLYQQAVHVLGGNGNVVSRWHDRIRFAAVGFEDRAEAREVLESATRTAGLEFSFPIEEPTSPDTYLTTLEGTPPYALWTPCAGSPFSCVNFVAVRTNSETMRAIAKAVPLPVEHVRALELDAELPCFFYAFRDGRLQIRQAVVFINEALDAPMRKTCLNEEIHQAFGMFGDYTGSTDFSFNKVVAPKQITRYDRLLMKALYDPRVKAGYPVHHVATLFVELVRGEGLPVR